MSVGYIPNRGDIIWLDFDPTKGKEIGKYRPAFVLSSQAYNQQTGLLICCPVSSSIRGGLTEVPVNNLDKPSVVASSLVQTLSWKERKAQFIVKAEDGVLNSVLQRLLPLIGASDIV
ncbi:type II toxin-antitoxin system PemK/MazF family toxin [Thiomicrospira microaerophila]|uniref:type II toxin-antitoxin system PemK/MazF family toxin n=1 Tax=Thiomicrospira microaerophila TaxID=406020 RepID=UPI00200E08A7|nr:type II toxin-antitoxin system PemK/MazF family toxin [Thiomicrospira microaerophila]UQB42258.1 type II toxin-antitoxin system PemK/MazF family toxin [Thiomicrospira microaerophila]